MKKLIAPILFLIGISLYAQQDPEAKKILDRVSEKNKQYTTIQSDFELSIENRREDITTSNKGSIKIKGQKYYLESPGTKVYFDGNTLWTYMEDVKEVSISEPDKSSGDFLENPTMIFDFYTRDFKYRLVGEVKLDAGWMYEIDLFPIDLDQPYSRFKIFITRDSEEIYKVSAIGKDGVDYTATIKNTKYNLPLNDEIFTFHPEKYKGVEIIDMRF
jgi:outer membrane lipoprotein carrier protein